MTLRVPYSPVPVRGRIKLGTVNGQVDARRGHALDDGDLVVVNLPSGAVGAVVKQN